MATSRPKPLVPKACLKKNRFAKGGKVKTKCKKKC